MALATGSPPIIVPLDLPRAGPATDEFPADLRFAVAAISQRFNTCRTISLQDVDDELPSRGLSRREIDALLQNLADHGIRIIEDDAADRLAL